jgi:ribosome maturation factor RimP
MEEKIIHLLEEKLKDEGFEDLYLEELTFNPANKKLEIFLDSDATLTVGQCSQINKYLQKHIDEEGWLGEKYTLDVSSPGVGKPLKFKRQYIKNVGRKVEIKTESSGVREGSLVEVHEEFLVIEEKVKADPKKKKKILQKAEIQFSDIKQTKVKISF